MSEQEVKTEVTLSPVAQKADEAMGGKLGIGKGQFWNVRTPLDAKPTPPPRWPHSSEIALIAGALAKAQVLIKGAVKDSNNPHFKSQYADLSSVWDSCHEALNKNEICVVQQTETLDGKLVLVTRLIHSSGQWFRSEFPVKPQQDTPQGIGSAITYARRYSLAAMAGVAPRGDDDDGNAASAPVANREPPKGSWGDLKESTLAQTSEKPQRPAGASFAPLGDTVDRLPADVAKVRRELERFAEKPFTDLETAELGGLARTLDGLAAKATQKENKLVLATLASVVTAEFGKRQTAGNAAAGSAA